MKFLLLGIFISVVGSISAQAQTEIPARQIHRQQTGDKVQGFKCIKAPYSAYHLACRNLSTGEVTIGRLSRFESPFVSQVTYGARIMAETMAITDTYEVTETCDLSITTNTDASTMQLGKIESIRYSWDMNLEDMRQTLIARGIAEEQAQSEAEKILIELEQTATKCNVNNSRPKSERDKRVFTLHVKSFTTPDINLVIKTYDWDAAIDGYGGLTKPLYTNTEQKTKIDVPLEQLPETLKEGRFYMVPFSKNLFYETPEGEVFVLGFGYYQSESGLEKFDGYIGAYYLEIRAKNKTRLAQIAQGEAAALTLNSYQIPEYEFLSVEVKGDKNNLERVKHMNRLLQNMPAHVFLNDQDYALFYAVAAVIADPRTDFVRAIVIDDNKEGQELLRERDFSGVAEFFEGKKSGMSMILYPKTVSADLGHGTVNFYDKEGNITTLKWDGWGPIKYDIGVWLKGAAKSRRYWHDETRRIVHKGFLPQLGLQEVYGTDTIIH